MTYASIADVLADLRDRHPSAQAAGRSERRAWWDENVEVLRRLRELVD